MPGKKYRVRLNKARGCRLTLNPKQQRFCEEYVVDLNGTKAAIRAGYSQRSAAVQSARLLIKDNIKTKIDELKSKKSQKVQITAELVLGELLKLATADLSLAYDEHGNLKPIKDIPEAVRKCISSVESFEEYQGAGKDRLYIGETKKIKFWDKTKSLDLLGRHLALFTDNIDLSSKDGSMTPKSAITINQMKISDKIFDDLLRIDEKLRLPAAIVK